MANLHPRQPAGLRAAGPAGVLGAACRGRCAALAVDCRALPSGTCGCKWRHGLSHSPLQAMCYIRLITSPQVKTRYGVEYMKCMGLDRIPHRRGNTGANIISSGTSPYAVSRSVSACPSLALCCPSFLEIHQVASLCLHQQTSHLVVAPLLKKCLLPRSDSETCRTVIT